MKRVIQQINSLRIITLISLLLLVSCGNEHYYNKTFSFNDNEWDQRVKPRYEVTIEDTSSYYNFILTLRTTTEYRYNNLWIYWNSETPDKNIPKAREPFELKIQDKNGNWLGKESGTIVENQLIFQRRKFTIPGKYVFTIEQGITESRIDEVLDLALTVEKAEKK